MNIIQHTEKFLGKIVYGWKEKNNQNTQVVLFNNVPFDKINTVVTLGLSNHVLTLSKSKKIRQELLISLHEEIDTHDFVNFLFSLCELILMKHEGLLRGQTINIHTDFHIPFSHFYCSIPVFFDEKFTTYNQKNPATVFVMMIPIYINEYNFIVNNGWSKFESILEERNVDIFSLYRDSVI